MCAVSVEPQILRTKLYPPRLPEIVVRERLLSDLESARSAKLTSVVAGAGYGKSTLAAEFLQRLRRPYVWYQLEDTDSDLSVFLSYIIAGLRSMNPEFGEETFQHMASLNNVAEQSRAVLSTFISELDQLVGEELFIVLDDFHQVNESPVITEAVDFCLDHMLPNLHFVILSRSALSLDLTALKAKRELLELTERHLRFTRDETARLFSEVFNMSLCREDITDLSESTEGWVSGLVLFYLALRGKTVDSVSSTIREPGLSLSDVFDYLAKATYENQSQEVKDFMVRTSLLSRMNPQFCNEFIGIDDSRDILSYLMDARLFTIPLDDTGNWYRYHHGQQFFLQRTLHENLLPQDVEELHLKAAALWEKSGDLEQALSHYMEARSYDRAADVLEGIISDLMVGNRTSFLYREISRLPEDARQKHPRIMMYDTQVSALLGDFDRTVDAARAAAAGFEEAGEGDKLARSLVYIAGGLFLAGKPDEALEMIITAREAMPPDSPYMYELLATEGLIYTSVGSSEEADPIIEEALRLINESRETDLAGQLLGWCGTALLAQGKLGRCLDVYSSANILLEGVGITAAHPFTYAFSSRVHMWLDRQEEAKQVAGEGIALGEEHGIPPMVSSNHGARAVAWAYEGKLDRALEDVSFATSVSHKYEPRIIAALTEYYLGEAQGLVGNKSACLSHLNRAEQMIDKYRYLKYLPKLARTAYTVQDLGLKGAVEKVEGIIAAVEGSGPKLALSLAYSLLFALKLAGDRPDEAREVLETYTNEYGEDVILRSYTADTDNLLAFFTDLFSEGKYLGLMHRVYGMGGAKSASYLKKLEKRGNAEVAALARGLLEALAGQAVEPLEISMLGPFQVTRVEKILSSNDWKSKKALTVLKYLALNREKGFIPRDVLMELLWPDVPPDAAAKSLNAALTAVRKTLEPESSRGASSYLVSKGDSLLLELGPGGWIDLELFEEKLSGAGKAKEVGDFDLYFHTLKEAEELYGGDLCCEDLYEDWCLFEREALESEYVNLVVNMATELLRRGEGAKALSHLDKAVAKDPGREELYRKQMIIYSQMGNRAGIVEAFRRCEKHLKDEYDATPSPATTELYEKLRME